MDKREAIIAPEYDYFDCEQCLYRKPAEDVMWSQCTHPEVLKTKFEGDGVESYTPEDFIKVDRLVNNVLHIGLSTMDNEEVPNFEWPFKFDTVHMVSCGGYVPRDFKTYDRGRKV